MPIKAWKKTFDTTLPYYKTHGKTQTAILNGVAEFRMAKEQGGPIIISVDLQQTSLSPGTPLEDARNEIGFFQDKITVQLRLENHPEFGRIADGPNTKDHNNQITSSVTVNFGGGGGGGFFGPMPMGTVNMSGGVTNTNSYSETFQDFDVRNDTQGSNIEHTYYMTHHSKGAYSHPSDLWWNTPDPIEGIQGPQVGRPPDLALHNFPIMSQAAWQANHTRESNETLILDIAITQHLTWVTCTPKGLLVHTESKGRTNTFTYYEKIPLHELNVTSRSVDLIR